MPTEVSERGVVMVPMSALDQDPGLRPQAHIFAGSKAPLVHDHQPSTAVLCHAGGLVCAYRKKTITNSGSKALPWHN